MPRFALRDDGSELSSSSLSTSCPLDEGGRATWSLACEGTEDRYQDRIAVSVDEPSETASESDDISLAGDLWRILEGAHEG
jgi:hypothetical protein